VVPLVGAIDSPCECEHDNSDSLDARLFLFVALAVAPWVSWVHPRTDASSIKEKMLRPWSEQARQLTPRRETVADLGNRGEPRVKGEE